MDCLYSWRVVWIERAPKAEAGSLEASLGADVERRDRAAMEDIFSDSYVWRI